MSTDDTPADPAQEAAPDELDTVDNTSGPIETTDPGESPPPDPANPPAPEESPPTPSVPVPMISSDGINFRDAFRLVRTLDDASLLDIVIAIGEQKAPQLVQGLRLIKSGREKGGVAGFDDCLAGAEMLADCTPSELDDRVIEAIACLKRNGLLDTIKHAVGLKLSGRTVTIATSGPAEEDFAAAGVPPAIAWGLVATLAELLRRR